MGKFVDLTGQRFGRLTVLERAPKIGRRTYWLCKCDCGTEKLICAEQLRSGKTQSCGCLHREISSKVMKELLRKQNSKGQTKTRLYRIWKGMKERCYSEKSPDYYRYGGRGIQICQEWRSDFFAFRSWALSCGYSDNLSIDRIDNDGNYCPENCRWATAIEQGNNRCSNVVLNAFGESHTIAEWAKISGVPKGALWWRLSRGWSIEQAIKVPLEKHDNPSYIYKGELHTLTEWGIITGLGRQCIWERLRRGWSIELALETPAETKFRPKHKK